MSDHDPLCPISVPLREGNECLICLCIRRARADEREFLAPEVPFARDDLRNELRAQVMALPDEHHYGPVGKNRCVKRADVLALLELP